MSVFSDCRWHSLLGRHCMHAHFSTGVVPLSPSLFIWLFFLLLLQDVNLDDELLEDWTPSLSSPFTSSAYAFVSQQHSQHVVHVRVEVCAALVWAGVEGWMLNTSLAAIKCGIIRLEGRGGGGSVDICRRWNHKNRKDIQQWKIRCVEGGSNVVLCQERSGETAYKS